VKTGSGTWCSWGPPNRRSAKEWSLDCGFDGMWVVPLVGLHPNKWSSFRGFGLVWLFQTPISEDDFQSDGFGEISEITLNK